MAALVRWSGDIERQDSSESVIEHTLAKQHHRCWHCNGVLNVVNHSYKNGLYNKKKNDQLVMNYLYYSMNVLST